MRDRALRDGFVVAVVLFSLFRGDLHACDAWTYWAFGSGSSYGHLQGSCDAFLYSPAAALVADPLGTLPWPVFLTAWTILLCAALWKVVGRWAFLVLLFPPVAFDIQAGNIHLLMALALVTGLRHPSAWAFLVLTKVTPGLVFVWYLARHEWRQVTTAVGATVLLAGISFLIAPALWSDWIDTLALNLARHSETGLGMAGLPLVPRLLGAAAVVSWGAVRDARWVLPIGAVLALPTLNANGLALLVALVPLGDWQGPASWVRSLGRRVGAVRPAAYPDADVDDAAA